MQLLTINAAAQIIGVAAMMRPIVVFALLSFSLTQSAQAHLADESSLRVKIEPHRLEIRLTFNLFTLTRFMKIDSDGDTKISLAELTAAETGIVDYLNKHVLIQINQQIAALGAEARFAWLWPNASKTAPMTEPDYAARNVDVIFIHEIKDRLVESFWIEFGIFEQTGPMQTIRGIFEQEGQVTEMPFSAREPDFLYATGYADDPFVQKAEEDRAQSPRGQRWWMVRAMVLIALLVLGRRTVLAARARKAVTRRRRARR